MGYVKRLAGGLTFAVVVAIASSSAIRAQPQIAQQYRATANTYEQQARRTSGKRAECLRRWAAYYRGLAAQLGGGRGAAKPRESADCREYAGSTASSASPSPQQQEKTFGGVESANKLSETLMKHFTSGRGAYLKEQTEAVDDLSRRAREAADAFEKSRESSESMRESREELGSRYESVERAADEMRDFFDAVEDRLTEFDPVEEKALEAWEERAEIPSPSLWSDEFEDSEDLEPAEIGVPTLDDTAVDLAGYLEDRNRRALDRLVEDAAAGLRDEFAGMMDVAPTDVDQAAVADSLESLAAPESTRPVTSGGFVRNDEGAQAELSLGDASSGSSVFGDALRDAPEWGDYEDGATGTAEAPPQSSFWERLKDRRASLYQAAKQKLSGELQGDVDAVPENVVGGFLRDGVDGAEQAVVDSVDGIFDVKGRIKSAVKDRVLAPVKKFFEDTRRNVFSNRLFGRPYDALNEAERASTDTVDSVVRGITEVSPFGRWRAGREMVDNYGRAFEKGVENNLRYGP